MSITSLPANLVAEIGTYLDSSDRCSMFIAVPGFAKKIEVAITFKHIQLWKTSNSGVQVGTVHVLERMAQRPDSGACIKVPAVSMYEIRRLALTCIRHWTSGSLVGMKPLDTIRESPQTWDTGRT